MYLWGDEYSPLAAHERWGDKLSAGRSLVYQQGFCIG